VVVVAVGGVEEDVGPGKAASLLAALTLIPDQEACSVKAV